MYKGYNNSEMAKLMSEALIGKPGSNQHQRLNQVMNKANNLTKVIGSETIVGQACEYTAMSELMNTRICYWKEMHEYPSYIKRSIILKSSVNLTKATNNPMFGDAQNIAIVFEKNIILSNTIFTVPAKFKIKDYTKR